MIIFMIDPRRLQCSVVFFHGHAAVTTILVFSVLAIKNHNLANFHH